MATALITGGSQRIGKAIAISLAEMGFDIIIHYNKSETEAKETEHEIENLGVKCSAIKADLTSERDIDFLISESFSKFGNIQILINNASIYGGKSIKETSKNELMKYLETNFVSPFLLTREFAKRCNYGQIINIIDAKLDNRDPNLSAYLTSKKALAYFTELSAKELAPNIRINAIYPGAILPPNTTGNDQKLKSVINDAPLQISANLKHITSAVRFLIDNNFITGESLYVDGGQHLK